MLAILARFLYIYGVVSTGEIEDSSNVLHSPKYISWGRVILSEHGTCWLAYLCTALCLVEGLLTGYIQIYYLFTYFTHLTWKGLITVVSSLMNSLLYRNTKSPAEKLNRILKWTEVDLEGQLAIHTLCSAW